MVIGSYAVYIVLTLGVTIWVAQTLHRNGQVFLVDSFHGNEALADSVNHLLVVGFYLINVGYIAFVLQSREKPEDLVRAVEILSRKIGVVLLVLGAMHFINIKIFSSMRRRSMRTLPPPPVQPDARVPLPTS
jgi:hypothetical protein